MSTQQVAVGIEIDGETVLAGVLLVDLSTSGTVDRSIGRFRYAGSYLRNPKAVTLDPVLLPLTSAEFRFAKFGGLPGALRDSAPDNWGRNIIEQLHRAAGVSGLIPEVDFLLASPQDRTGNLHFSSRIPPVWGDKQIKSDSNLELAKLQQHVLEILSLGYQGKHAAPDVVRMMATGSGGARPKVNIKSAQGAFMFKLGIPDDKGSVARMEAGSLKLARECNILAVDVRVRDDVSFDIVQVRRFDRDKAGRRIQVVSAMTVLGANDAAYDRTNWSYPMLARELDRWSADPAEDKLQLFRCMVLRAMLSDSDDHPRNYSLLRVGDKPGSTFHQWRLSPMYDCVVGMGQGRRADELAMTIGKEGYKISKSNILSECASFGLTVEVATEEMNKIEQTVLRRWRPVMEAMNMSNGDLAQVAGAIAPLDERETMNAVARLVQRLSSTMEDQQVESDESDEDQQQVERSQRPRG